MSNEIAIIKKENVDMIVSSAPQAYQENRVSRERCLQVGSSLLERIQKEGMSDALDQEAASFIERARKTVRKMNDKRAPVTKLFDEIRAQFTSMENEVDPAKRDSIPCRLQQLRNEYAAKKRAEEEQRRRAAMVEQQKQASIAKYRTDVEEDYRRVFNGLLNSALNYLMRLNSAVTLDNYDKTLDTISKYSTKLDESTLVSSRSMVLLPTNVSTDELTKVRESVLANILPAFRNQYSQELSTSIQEYTYMLPSKKQELDRAAKAASEEEAESIKREIAEREAQEAARKEQERIAKEQEQQKAAELRKQTDEMNNLFGGAAASVATYQPKTSVKKKIVVLNPEGFMPIISMWWSKVGCSMSVEELSKVFKKQLSFCESLANDKSCAEFIEDESISYEDDVKAK